MDWCAWFWTHKAYISERMGCHLGLPHLWSVGHTIIAEVLRKWKGLDEVGVALLEVG